jgi:hypothetical protein
MFQKRMLSWVVMVGAGVGVGCASTQASSAPSGPGYPLGQPRGESLRLDGESLTGPNSSLRLVDSGLRGQFQGAPVDVSWTDTALTGTVAQRPARVQLDAGTDLHIWGSFGPERVDFTLKPDRVEGQVGRCVYELRREDFGLAGQRSCAGPLEGEFRVNFPAPLFARPAGEKAALMILALVNTTSTYATIISPSRQLPPPDRIGPSNAYRSPRADRPAR